MFKYYQSILIFAGLFPCISASPVHEPHVVHHERGDSPGWRKSHRIHSGSLIRMRVALTQNNLDRGHEMLMDISHPESQNYGKRYSDEELVSLFSPTDDTVKEVKSWLISSGIDKKRITHTKNRGWLVFDAWPEEAEKLLKTKFHVFEHTESGKLDVAGDNYSIPQRLQKHIEFITPGTILRPDPAPKTSNSLEKRQLEPHGSYIPANPLENCKKYLTPECVMRLYNIPPPTYTQPNPNNSLGVWVPVGGIDKHDLNNFYTSFAPHIPNGTVPIIKSVDGGRGIVSKSFDHIDFESTLSTEMAMPIIYPQNVTLFNTMSQWAYDNYHDYFANDYSPDAKAKGWFNDFLDALDGTYCTLCKFGECGDDEELDPPVPNPGYPHKLECGIYQPPNVLSITFGLREWELPGYYQRRQCYEWMKLGLKGTSVVVANGDWFQECGVKLPSHFVSYYPNSCPYVTNVGGTRLTKTGEGIGLPERTIFFTSGSFSNLFARPDYQNTAIESWFRNYDPGYPTYASLNGTWGEGYNRIGRALPDIAAVSDNFLQYFGSYSQNDSYIQSGGVSQATPLVAAIFTRINEERLAAGKSTVGFVNPALYNNPQMLNDIVLGEAPTNRSCVHFTEDHHGINKDAPGWRSQPGWGKGFRAVPGWDPNTGMGTPNYPLMLNYFMSLP